MEKVLRLSNESTTFHKFVFAKLIFGLAHVQFRNFNKYFWLYLVFYGKKKRENLKGFRINDPPESTAVFDKKRQSLIKKSKYELTNKTPPLFWDEQNEKLEEDISDMLLT